MATIKERATLDANKYVGEKGHFGAWQSHRLAYIRVATDQRTIDIEKACEWLIQNALCDGIEYRFDIDEFRKAMMEE